MTRLVEVEDPVHVSVVGDTECWLPITRRSRDGIGDTCRSIEHGELGVGVKMDKRSGHVKWFSWVLRWFYRCLMAPWKESSPTESVLIA